MTLMRYEPWSVLGQMQRELGRAFADSHLVHEDDDTSVLARWAPAVDIKESETAYELHADLPGVNAEDIEITHDNGVLAIKGERKFSNEEEREGYKRIERSYGSFYRRFSLPETVDAENIEAKVSDGVLEIVIPKQEKTQPKKITVKA